LQPIAGGGETQVTAKGLSKDRFDRLGDILNNYVERGEVAGFVAAARRGDKSYVATVGVQALDSGVPMQRDTIFRVLSMTKIPIAVAAMMLVEETKLRLDDPVDRFLPELANRQVLRSIESPIDDTVPAERSITLRDLLTFRLGIGMVMAPPDTYPIQAAFEAAQLGFGPKSPALTPDEWMQLLGELPLMYQPGTTWLYNTGSDILGVLIARAAGTSLPAFMQERIFGPLGMKDTAFSVPESKLDRLATCYDVDAESGKLVVLDEPRGAWSRPPLFPSGAGGLVSTADDMLTFGRMMLDDGRLGTTRILSRPAVQLMTMDHLTAEQKARSPFVPGFWETTGWGFGTSVTVRQEGIGRSVGSFGWSGGYNTHWFADPKEDLVATLLLQRNLGNALSNDFIADFETLIYQAVDD
jgi:CubicO group peptidase (beta-lactamase class C family)